MIKNPDDFQLISFYVEMSFTFLMKYSKVLLMVHPLTSTSHLPTVAPWTPWASDVSVQLIPFNCYTHSHITCSRDTGNVVQFGNFPKRWHLQLEQFHQSLGIELSYLFQSYLSIGTQRCKQSIEVGLRRLMWSIYCSNYELIGKRCSDHDLDLGLFWFLVSYNEFEEVNCL